mmetsp:Transcript_11654/g.13270  ORF Transcript_11654/g.13270 Transcript_11654/m.13270 type:complete len:81 (-) Transcript_11654:330-572(-)
MRFNHDKHAVHASIGPRNCKSGGPGPGAWVVQDEGYKEPSLQLCQYIEPSGLERIPYVQGPDDYNLKRGETEDNGRYRPS